MNTDLRLAMDELRPSTLAAIYVDTRRYRKELDRLDKSQPIGVDLHQHYDYCATVMGEIESYWIEHNPELDFEQMVEDNG